MRILVASPIRTGVDADMPQGDRVAVTAAAHGDRALFDTLLRELKKTQDLRERSAIIGALGSFRDPKLAAAALDLVIHSDND